MSEQIASIPVDGVLQPQCSECEQLGPRNNAGTVRLFRHALSQTLFSRLLTAVCEVGTERLNANGSYTTTFWYPLNRNPANIVEDCIGPLHELVQPGTQCIGIEWWLGRLKYGKPLALHFDRDLSLKKLTGRSVHPLWSSILYLNTFPSSPTVILDQILADDGKTITPPIATWKREMPPIPNHYVVFQGNLRHGVVANQTAWPGNGTGTGEQQESGLRLSLLVNYWHVRPAPPVCHDYDGTVYQALQRHRFMAA